MNYLTKVCTYGTRCFYQIPTVSRFHDVIAVVLYSLSMKWTGSESLVLLTVHVCREVIKVYGLRIFGLHLAAEHGLMAFSLSIICVTTGQGSISKP
jgi:hypothetical protein